MKNYKKLKIYKLKKKTLESTHKLKIFNNLQIIKKIIIFNILISMILQEVRQNKIKI